MEQPTDLSGAAGMASAIRAELDALPVRNTATMRAVRRKYSAWLRPASADVVLQVARILLENAATRWIAYELVRAHRSAFQSLDEAMLEALGQGINSWWTVDAFARTLSGPAWLNGQVSDAAIMKWASSGDPWWRRAALVSTVALNVRSHGGKGDVFRTLPIFRLLAHDHRDMVAKALSWALRELVVHDERAIRDFLDEHDVILAARVKREVKNKLRTGLKTPRRGNK